MRRRTILAAGIAIIAAIVLFAAVGYGGGTSTAALGGGAEVAPADTAAFVALDTNMDSSQWQALDGLLAKFPGYETLVRAYEEEGWTPGDGGDDDRPGLAA